MTGRGKVSDETAAGGPARHAPVLLDEVIAALAIRPGARILDGTFGAGGYSARILAAGGEVLALDRDPDAIAGGYGAVARAGGKLTLAQANFGDLAEEAAGFGFAPLDGVVLDIGVSSMQLDQAGRGFSFRFDAPLDMRMSQAGRSAADIVNEASEAELADIIYHYGEERRARAVARAIAQARTLAPIATTKQLADIVAGVVRKEPGGIHPATRTFQALRIAVNDELGELVRALHGAEQVLSPGGRLVVVTFHSLEDRIVKNFLNARSGRAAAQAVSRHLPQPEQKAATFTLLGRNPVTPGSAELAANPRARSAKLRAALRTAAPAGAEDRDTLALAALPAHDARDRRSGGRR